MNKDDFQKLELGTVLVAPQSWCAMPIPEGVNQYVVLDLSGKNEDQSIVARSKDYSIAGRRLVLLARNAFRGKKSLLSAFRAVRGTAQEIIAVNLGLIDQETGVWAEGDPSVAGTIIDIDVPDWFVEIVPSHMNTLPEIERGKDGRAVVLPVRSYG